jgi:hypothetical protein
VSRPGFNEGSIHGEVLIRQQVTLPSLGQYLVKEGMGDIPLQQALPVLANGRGVPDGIIHVHAHKPPKQQVIIELLSQQPRTANGVEHLEP